MKKHFKLILAALSAFLLFLTNVPVVNASENDVSQVSDSSSSNEEKQQYKYTITYRFVDFASSLDGGYMVATYITDSPLYIYKFNTDEPAIYLRYFSNGVESTDLNGLKNGSSSHITYYPNGEIALKNPFGASGISYRGKTKVIVEATCPIFRDRESLDNYLETGSTDGWENYIPDKDWNYSGTINATDSTTNAEDKSYSLCSDGRLAILNEEEYTYQLYTGTGSKIYENTGNGLVNLSLDGVLWYNLFPMARYNSYKSTIPIFTSREKLLNYIETGSYDGCTNIGNIGLPSETGLPYLQNVAWSSVSDCYGGMPYIMGDQISWAVNNFPWRNGGKVELYGDFEIKVFNNSVSEIAAGLSDTIVFNVALSSEDFEKIGLGFTDFNEGKVILPSDKVQQLLQSKLDSIYGENRYKYISHKFTNLYVRCVWEKLEEGRILTSRWVKVSPGDSLDNFGHVVTGDIGEIKNGQFTFTDDTESDSSYEYNKDFNGNYPFEKDDDGGGIKIPTSIDEALSSFVDIIGALIKSMGKVPALVKTVFGFLPNVFFVLIGCSFTVVVILRILGR